MNNIDLLDKKLLQLLIQDGRLDYAKIAKKTGTSLERIKYRINRLINKKIILGFRTILNYKAIGYTEYTVFIKLKKLNKETRKAAEEFLKKHPFTLWVGTCVGEYDLRINVIAKNPEQLKKTMDEIEKGLIQEIKEYNILSRIQKNIRKNYLIFSYLSTPEEIEEIKKVKTEIPKEKSKDIKILDEKDWQIIKILSKDSRITYRKIGKEMNLTGENIKYRVKKILSTNIIKKFSISIDFTKFGLIWWNLLLRTNKQEEENITNHIINHAQTSNMIKYVGNWDYEVTFFSKNIEDADKYLLELRDKFGENFLDMKTIIINDSLKHPQVAEGIFTSFS